MRGSTHILDQVHVRQFLIQDGIADFLRRSVFDWRYSNLGVRIAVAEIDYGRCLRLETAALVAKLLPPASTMLLRRYLKHRVNLLYAAG